MKKRSYSEFDRCYGVIPKPAPDFTVHWSREDLIVDLEKNVGCLWVVDEDELGKLCIFPFTGFYDSRFYGYIQTIKPRTKKFNPMTVFSYI